MGGRRTLTGDTVPVSQEEESSRPPAKKRKCRKLDIDKLEDEFLCAITQELPVDAVTAEDGRVYEREAIERWCAQQPGVWSKSPVTNEAMGKGLFPATHVRSILMRLIAEGVIAGERATVWRAAVQAEQDRKTIASLKQKAEAGDLRAMTELGVAHHKARHGLTKDTKTALALYQKAGLAGHPPALTRAAIMLLMGDGVVRPNATYGMQLMFASAMMGSEHACEHLGHSFSTGEWGYSKSTEDALFWYKKMKDCAHKDSVEYARNRARVFLQVWDVSQPSSQLDADTEDDACNSEVERGAASEPLGDDTDENTDDETALE